MVDAGQLEMRYDVPVDPAASASIEDVEKVVGILSRAERMTAAEIAAELGLPATENSKRKVRAIASAARPGIVSFPNSAGYKLLRNCTLQELSACISAWDAVIRDATATKKGYLEAYHSRSLEPNEVQPRTV